jgi:hypothetical protein
LRKALLRLTLLTCLLGAGTTATAHAYEQQYCYNGHSAGFQCTGGLGAHSWDYNRMYTDVAVACQRLETPAGNVRAGSSCGSGSNYLTAANFYSGGTPMSIAYCWNSTSTSFYNCLANT